VKDKLAPEWGDFQTLATPPRYPPPFTGEGDRRRRWRGRLHPQGLEGSASPGGQTSAPDLAPSTMLRIVPLPRFAGEDRKASQPYRPPH